MDERTVQQTLRALYDLRRLAPLAATAGALDPAGAPAWQSVAPLGAPAPRRLGLLAGSFNPPTSAHLALAQAVLDTAGLDELALTISRVTVDKEAVTRAALPDRLLLLSLIVERLNATRGAGGLTSAALINRGLYADQAVAVRATLPHLHELVFVIGYDKIVQIFDPRYYDDREAALDRLFGHASFLVAPRAGQGAADLVDLLASPANRRYRSSVQALALPADYADQSSSAVRMGLPGSAAQTYLPPEAAIFIAETRPYTEQGPPAGGPSHDPYGARLALLERLLAQPPFPAPDEVRGLYQRAVQQ